MVLKLNIVKRKTGPTESFAYKRNLEPSMSFLLNTFVFNLITKELSDFQRSQNQTVQKPISDYKVLASPKIDFRFPICCIHCFILDYKVAFC